MTMLTTPAAAATVSALTTRVRTMIGDTSTATDMQRWADALIRQAIDDMIAQMYMEVASWDPSGFLTYDNLTYVANNDPNGTALPAGRERYPIYRVEDITVSGFPAHLDFLNPMDAQEFGDAYGWTFEGDRIVLVPEPTSARTLRIWSLKPFIPTANASTPATDQHALSINHEELIALGAAIRLQEVDDEVSPSRQLRYEQLWQLYQKTLDRYWGSTYVRSARKILR